LDVPRIYSEIPASHPAKAAIEDACKEPLAGLPGDWEVDILPGDPGNWWIIGITGPEFYSWIQVVPAEQTPRRVRDRVAEALRDGGIR